MLKLTINRTDARHWCPTLSSYKNLLFSLPIAILDSSRF